MAVTGREKQLATEGPAPPRKKMLQRKNMKKEGEPLRGIYSGQPGRKANNPCAETLLEAFNGITLTVFEISGKRTCHVTALTDVQERLLRLWGLPPDLYSRLASPI